MPGLIELLGLKPPRGTAAPAADPTAPSGPPAADLAVARRLLVGARDELGTALAKADAQIRKLQALLAVHPDPDLKAIAGSADFGLNALTGNHRVRILAVLRELEASPPQGLPPLLARARAIVASFDNHLRTSDRLAACDENPLGVTVQVRALLSPVLARLSRAVESFPR